MIKDKIKIYQGGSTGLVQQKSIRTDSAKIKSSYIFKDIKDTLKDLHKMEKFSCYRGRCRINTQGI